MGGDGTGGTHRGILTGAGIAVTYTDASPTAAELYPKLFQALSETTSAVFLTGTHFLMHPRRWFWLASQVGTSFPFLQLGNAPQGAAGQVLGGQRYEAPGGAGVLSTLPAIMDGTIPTNLGPARTRTRSCA